MATDTMAMYIDRRRYERKAACFSINKMVQTEEIEG
jgi:hypothetical protein